MQRAQGRRSSRASMKLGHAGGDRREGDAVAVLASGQPQCQGSVGFAGAGRPERNAVLAPLDPIAARQFQNRRFVERGLGGEVEGVEAFGLWKARQPDAALDVAPLAIDALQFDVARYTKAPISGALLLLRQKGCIAVLEDAAVETLSNSFPKCASATRRTRPTIAEGTGTIATLLPKAGNSNTLGRTGLLDRLCAVFPDIKISSLMGDREFIGDAWTAYLHEAEISFILRLCENQYVVREGYETSTIATIARHLNKGQKTILKGACRLGQNEQVSSPPIQSLFSERWVLV